MSDCRRLTGHSPGQFSTPAGQGGSHGGSFVWILAPETPRGHLRSSVSWCLPGDSFGVPFLLNLPLVNRNQNTLGRVAESQPLGRCKSSRQLMAPLELWVGGWVVLFGVAFAVCFESRPRGWATFRYSRTALVCPDVSHVKNMSAIPPPICG